MKLEEIWVLVRSADKRFGPSSVVSEETFHHMLFADTSVFDPCVDSDLQSRIRGYVSFSRMINDGVLSLGDVADSLTAAWAGYSEGDGDYEHDMETVSLVKATLLNPQLLHNSKVFVQERSQVDDLPECFVGDRPESKQAMAGYGVATQYGVYEDRAFNLVDDMFRAFQFPINPPIHIEPAKTAVPTAQPNHEPWLL